MKVSVLLHNPGAGEEKYTGEELVSIVESLGFKCRYSSTKKKGWNEIEDDTDFVIIAGGDGTIRKVVKKFLNKKTLRKRIPIALLPLGTANNISKTLGIAGEPEVLGKTWHEKNIKKFDVGFIDGMEETNFFLEGFGYGIFPMLMQKMKEEDEETFSSLDHEITYSLKVLHDIILTYKAKNLELEIDKIDYSGKYLMAEVMNTRSIGPNLQLAPKADPGDGEMEVVLVPDNQRAKLAMYVQNKLNGVEDPFAFNAIKAKSIHMHCDSNAIHIDDELIQIEKEVDLRIELFDGLLKFFAPDLKESLYKR
jgi:diacylglycerol kinase family enzyme